MNIGDFQTVTYLGIKEKKEDEIEFFILGSSNDMISCKTSIENTAREAFLETLNVGTLIQIQADSKDKENIRVSAFMI